MCTPVSSVHKLQILTALVLAVAAGEVERSSLGSTASHALPTPPQGRCSHSSDAARPRWTGGRRAEPRPSLVPAGALPRLRGGALEVSWRPAPLQMTRPWLEATTFDGSQVESRFDETWSRGDSSNEVLLHMAAELGDASAVSRLVENGTDVDCENLSGQTPLMKAAMMGHESLQCLSTLLRCGADVLKKDLSGLTAADWARQSIEFGCDCEEALSLLEQAEAIASEVRAVNTDDGVEGGGESELEGEEGLVRRAAEAAAGANAGDKADLGEGGGQEDTEAAEKRKRDSERAIQTLSASSRGQVPMSMEEYMEIAAMQSLERKREEDEKLAAMRKSRDEEDLLGGTDGLESGKKRVPNKRKYKNVRDRWAKLKARRRARKGGPKEG